MREENVVIRGELLRNADARLDAAWSLEILSVHRLVCEPRKKFLAAPPAWRGKWLAEIVKPRAPELLTRLIVVASKRWDDRRNRIKPMHLLAPFEPERVARNGPDCVFLTPRLAVLATKNQRPP